MLNLGLFSWFLRGLFKGIQFYRRFHGTDFGKLLSEHDIDDAIFISLRDSSGISREIILNHSSIKFSTKTLAHCHSTLHSNWDP